MLTLAIHISFGWQAFQAIGEMTYAQPRYYYAVWPGMALAAAIAVMALPGRWRDYSMIVLLATTLSTTIIGSVLAANIVLGAMAFYRTW